MANYRIQLKDREGNLLFPNVLSNSSYVTEGELSDALAPIYASLGSLSDSLSTLSGRVTSLEGQLSGKLTRLIVEELPTEDISTTTIYMVPKDGSDSTPNNVYTEYLYVNNQWEIIGDTSVNVDGFITESDAQELIDTALQGYATENYVDGAISDALAAYATKTYVDTAVSNAYNTLDALIKLDYVVLT